jgi:phosphatidylglycerophosphatase A
MAEEIVEINEQKVTDKETSLLASIGWSWHNWVGVIAAVFGFMLLIPFLLAAVGYTPARGFFMNHSPVDLDDLQAIIVSITGGVYIYAVWLQRPREFSFFNPVWHFATCFGLGYISRYFKKWWSYAIVVIAAVLFTMWSVEAMPLQTAIAIVVLAVCLKGAGTLGTLFGCGLVVLIVLLPSQMNVVPLLDIPFTPETMIYSFIGITVLVSILGTVASQIYVNRTGRQDPSEVIIDEVAGMFVAVIIGAGFFAYLINYVDSEYTKMVRMALEMLLLMFFFFRIFDIFKPYPINRLEKAKPEGWGIMVDDLMAGVYAGILFILVFTALDALGALDLLFINTGS